MLKFIALALIASSATDASRLDIIGGKDVDPPGMIYVLSSLSFCVVHIAFSRVLQHTR